MMLEKKIANKLKNQEIDPQDNMLFEKIMTERGKRSGKAGFLLIGSIALMFVLITGFTVSEYWGKIPQDGYSQEDIALIRAEAAGAQANANEFQAEKVTTEISNEVTTSQENDLVVNQPSAQLQNSKDAAIDFIKVDKHIQVKVAQNKQIKGTTDDSKKIIAKSKIETQKINPIENKLTKNIDPKSNTKFTATNRQLKPIATDFAMTVSNTKTTQSDKKEDHSTEENSNKSLYKLWPREINFYAGSYYNQRFIQDNGNAMGKMVNDYDAIESTRLFGFNAEYNLKKSIFAQLGFQWMTVNSSIRNYSIQTINHRQETVIDPGGQNQVRDFYDTTSTLVQGGNSSNQYLEIPITIGARWQIKKHIIQPQFGFVTSFYSIGNGWDFTPTGELQAIQTRNQRLAGVNLQVITGVSYTYMIGTRLGLYINPNLRYGLTNQTKKSYGFNEYSSMIGGQVGVKYILK